MNKQNFENLEAEAEKRRKKRDKKKKKNMKVSGAGVKTLQKIIRDKM
ncbi:MAG: hypothetical protein WC619_06205 [Patescibacteria group bacterium]